MNPAPKYDASDIKVLKGLEGVRKRPSMYIGDVGKRGLHHLVYELVDNAVDEALAGFCKNIKVVIHQDGSVTVSDDGRGIPVGKHPEAGVSALEVVMTTLHAGGKFDQKAYVISGGLHGVGASVVNALSQWFVAKVKREGKVWRQRYERGLRVSDLEVVGETDETGTELTFKPDPEIFKETEFEFETLTNRMRELAFLVAGINITVVDENTDAKAEFLYQGGLKEFVQYLDEAREPLFKPVFYTNYTDPDTGVGVELALEYTEAFSEIVLTYANTIQTHEGGTHLTGFRAALTRALNDFGKQRGLLKNGNKTLSGEDVREGLTAVLHVKLPDPQFEGQTKTKLGNGYVRGIVETGVYERFWRFLEENPKHAAAIISKAVLAAKGREAARKARELTRRKGFLESDALPGKLTDCISKDRDSSELFIVEGESAGGNAKQGRDRHTQAVLPLRGKILNVEKSTMDRSLSNNEIRTIISAIGAGIGEECKAEESRYGKIIIMTDADVDGAHIRTLLLTFFYRYMKPLVEEGLIYIAMPPLYRASRGKKVWYLYSDEELEELRKAEGDKLSVQRYKGLGEMNVDQLWETTMNPETRTLKRVSVEDAENAERLFSILMGDKVEPRKRFIEENALKAANIDI